jgi:hypothetical protein
MPKHSQRKLIVLASLVSVLTATSALLLALAPPPIGSQPSFDNLWAADPDGGRDLIAAISKTAAPQQSDHWKYIYVHQSNTTQGTARGLGDHFVIGNGLQSQDGQILLTQRWNHQSPASAPAGAASIDPSCISICLIGRLDADKPTDAQIHRLTELVSALQSQFSIGGDRVYLLDAAGPAGVGRLFPTSTVRAGILP